MTVQSMTGFGHGNAQGGGLRILVEVSSVNRKQLDVVVNAPRTLLSLEPWLVEQVSRRISRGRVTLQLAVQHAGGHAFGVVIDNRLARRTADALKQLARHCDVDPAVTVGDLLRIPGIVTASSADPQAEAVKPLLAKALDQALDAFTAMRRREGVALARELSTRLDHLEKISAAVSRRAPALVKHYRRALSQRVRALAGELPVPDERLEKEVVLMADRSDITEELTRLGSHIEQARGMLRQKEPSGRSLDFLAQEMFREINTIAAKASDARIAASVVQFKAELERFREQTQNIE
ncbi:MAG TPA: YicC family protein [Kiritimatiellia bacterium]|nr:YicC family protein [Kiritimatiellia bacterium]